jgi:hypothetical protein
MTEENSDRYRSVWLNSSFVHCKLDAQLKAQNMNVGKDEIRSHDQKEMANAL